MVIKPGSKYFPLFAYLNQIQADRLVLTFEQIEGILNAQLPRSAHSSRSFWGNRSTGSQAGAWMDAGFHVVELDLQKEQVTFGRPVIRYDVHREGDLVVWDAEMVRALRAHLSMSQTQFAQLLAVRQQTVSEWETGVYAPTRARSQHLTIVAERAEFPFDAGSEGVYLDQDKA